MNHLLHGFCNNRLSAIYLDVIKDRLYCSAPNDTTRRAGQTVLYELLTAISGMLAPVLVFTADEAREFGRFMDGNIHMSDFPTAKPEWKAPDIDAKWLVLLKLRNDVSAQLELARRDKLIGHNLDAAVTIQPANEKDEQFLTENLALLKMLFIVSDVEVGQVISDGPESGSGGADEEGRKIAVSRFDAPKCERCWMRDRNLGQDPEHPGLCPRCSDVIQRTDGE